jgi:hypothetical protein
MEAIGRGMWRSQVKHDKIAVLWTCLVLKVQVLILSDALWLVDMQVELSSQNPTMLVMLVPDKCLTSYSAVGGGKFWFSVCPFS